MARVMFFYNILCCVLMTRIFEGYQNKICKGEPIEDQTYVKDKFWHAMRRRRKLKINSKKTWLTTFFQRPKNV